MKKIIILLLIPLFSVGQYKSIHELNSKMSEFSFRGHFDKFNYIGISEEDCKNLLASKNDSLLKIGFIFLDINESINFFKSLDDKSSAGIRYRLQKFTGAINSLKNEYPSVNIKGYSAILDTCKKYNEESLVINENINTVSSQNEEDKKMRIQFQKDEDVRWSRKKDSLRLVNELEERMRIEKNNVELKKILSKKYGSKNADLIMKNKLKFGFDMDMCEMSYGHPDNIFETKTKEGTLVHWVYYNREANLTFKKGNLIAITE